jgi:hypothetical protein
MRVGASKWRQRDIRRAAAVSSPYGCVAAGADVLVAVPVMVAVVVDGVVVAEAAVECGVGLAPIIRSSL